MVAAGPQQGRSSVAAGSRQGRGRVAAGSQQGRDRVATGYPRSAMRPVAVLARLLAPMQMFHFRGHIVVAFGLLLPGMFDPCGCKPGCITVMRECELRRR